MIALALALLLADPSAPGPFAVDDRDEGPCTIFAPAKLEVAHPIILWGNGTNTPVVAYAPMLRHWASHGFVVAAAKTGQAGSGRDLLGCLDRLTQRNGEAGGFYEGKLDLTKVAASGHSQGGSGSLAAALDPRVTVVAPLQPAKAPAVGLKARVLLLSGGVDQVVARAQPLVFAAAEAPAVWATLKSASHTTPVRGGGPYVAATTAFFRWRLMDDSDAGRWFEGEACGLCTSRDWVVERK